MNILKQPLITEKSLINAKAGIYAFQVFKKAAKRQIKSEIEKIFSVNVTKITTTTIKGKVKRTGKQRKESKKPDWKKAIVTLKKGQKINLFPST